MRTIIGLIILIVVGAAAYTVFGIVTFEPTSPAPLVFREPDPETLKQIGIFADVTAPEEVVLTEEQKLKTRQAVQKITEALTVYQGYEQQATMRLSGTLSLIDGAIGSGQLPAYFLNVTDALSTNRAYEMLKFDPKNMLEVKQPQTSVTCVDGPEPTSILIGDNGDNVIKCESTSGKNDQILLGGPGNDTITDTYGNRIVNPGSGDDTITLGPGRSIVVLEDGWGHDKLTADCHGVNVAQSEIPQDSPVPWVSKFTNFIVLSPRISSDQIKWEGNVLKSMSSGDTLTVNEKCFTVVGIKE